MENNLKRIKLDYNLKKLDDRIEYVDSIIENNDILMSSIVNDNKNITIERLGTYLIRSEDVESCRKGENTFYETETDYRSRYKIGRNSYSMDISQGDAIINTSQSYDKYDFGENEDIVVDMSLLDNKQIIKMMRIAISEKDVHDSKLANFMGELYEYIRNTLSRDTDLEIFELLISNKTDSEISDALCIPRRTVNHNVNKISDVARGFSFDKRE